MKNYFDSLTGLIFISLGILFFALGSIVPEAYERNLIAPKVIGIVVILIGLFMSVFTYLNGEITNSPEKDIKKYSTEDSPFEKSYSGGESLDKLQTEIQQNLMLNLPKNILVEFEKKYANQNNYITHFQEILSTLSVISERFRNQTLESNRRNNINLGIGMTITFAAAGILIWTIFPNANTKAELKEITSVLQYYIPRITTVIFIEVFAFFFLKLYKSGLQETKYFQNELTNIEIYRVAYQAILLKDNSKSMQEIINQLIKTDRNSIKLIETKDSDSQVSMKDLGTLAETISKITGKG